MKKRYNIYTVFNSAGLMFVSHSDKESDFISHMKRLLNDRSVLDEYERFKKYSSYTIKFFFIYLFAMIPVVWIGNSTLKFYYGLFSVVLFVFIFLCVVFIFPILQWRLQRKFNDTIYRELEYNDSLKKFYNDEWHSAIYAKQVNFLPEYLEKYEKTSFDSTM